MGSPRTPYKILLWFSMILAPAMASAQVPELTPLRYQVRYDVSWNGVKLGRVRIETGEDDFGYWLTVDTKTQGMANLFGKNHGVSQAKGRVVEGQYLPSHYESRSRTHDDDARVTTIDYDEDGKIRKRTRKPSDDPAWRPVVPLAEANTATDPITAFFILRHRLRDNIANNVRETTIRTYEGARLASFSFAVISRARVEVMGKYVDAINVVPARTQLNGYTPKEIKKFKKGDPTVHLYFSADARFIPLAVEASLAFGTLRAELAEVKAR